MCLQYVQIKNSSIKAGSLFDNGSELVLISIIFANKNYLPYSISGVGRATKYNAATNGRIYTMPLVENNGKVVYIKAFSINNIISNKVGRSNINLNQGDEEEIL